MVKTGSNDMNYINFENYDSYVNYENQWNIYERDKGHKVITNTYFSLTTLSTIGIGDYYPTSNSERLICAFIFVFGVLTTTYVANQLYSTIIKLVSIGKTFNEEQELVKFFDTFKHFN